MSSHVHLRAETVPRTPPNGQTCQRLVSLAAPATGRISDAFLFMTVLSLLRANRQLRGASCLSFSTAEHLHGRALGELEDTWRRLFCHQETDIDDRGQNTEHRPF